MRSRGFSLIELTLVILLLSGMLLFSVMNFGGQRNRASSEALVQVVASELQAARALAIRNHSPVAVCFPTQGGRLAHSQSLYLMEGLARPHMTRVVDYSREFGLSVIAIGSWGNSTITRPSSGENYLAPSIQRWLGNGFQDFALVFTPDGAVTSNDLPLVDGAYRILVAHQVGYSPATAPPGVATMSTPPPYFAISKVYAPQSLSISPAGSLAIQSGVAHNAGVVVSPQAFAMAKPAAPPSIPIEAPQAPTIRLVEAQPRPTLNPKASVQQGRSLTLKVEASDDNGDPLVCTWTSQNVAGGQPGVFSAPANSPMQWDAQRQLWTLTTTWCPASTSAVGEEYRLSCKVSDPSGLSATQSDAALDPVTVIPPGRIAYTSYIDSAQFDLSVMNSDGSANKRLTRGAPEDWSPALSPDGTTIAFNSGGMTPEIFTMHVDGTGLRQLTNDGIGSGSPQWSVDGTQIFFDRNQLPLRIWAMNADGSGAQTVSTGLTDAGLKQSPDGRFVIYQNYGATVDLNRSELMVGEYLNDHISPPRIANPTNVTNNGVADVFAAWYPDNSGRLLYTTYNYLSFGVQTLFTMKTARVVDDGPSAVPRFRLTDVSAFGPPSSSVPFSYIKISPDLRRAVYNSTNNGASVVMIADVDLTVTPPTFTNPRVLRSGNRAGAGDWSHR